MDVMARQNEFLVAYCRQTKEWQLKSYLEIGTTLGWNDAEIEQVVAYLGNSRLLEFASHPMARLTSEGRQEADVAMFSVRDKGFFFSVTRRGVLFSHEGGATARQYLKHSSSPTEAPATGLTRTESTYRPDALEFPFGLWSVVKESAMAVPVNKNALGVVGIAAAVALVLTFLRDWRSAVFGTVIMVAMMVMVMVPGWHTSRNAARRKKARARRPCHLPPVHFHSPLRTHILPAYFYGACTWDYWMVRRG